MASLKAPKIIQRIKMGLPLNTIMYGSIVAVSSDGSLSRTDSSLASIDEIEIFGLTKRVLISVFQFQTSLSYSIRKIFENTTLEHMARAAILSHI